ncbi:MAG TPA: DUF1707 domain-containing protein [Nocardioidaceae bacterium]|jgi:hypothetical protein
MQGERPDRMEPRPEAGVAPADPSRLRISDDERHQVAEVLRQAAGEGRIDLAELDERLEATYAAKTYADLVPITADLPVHGRVQSRAPQPRPAAPVPAGPRYSSSVAFMSETKRHGAWLVPAEHMAFAMMGSVKLDLREAQFAAPEVTVNAVSIMGEVTIVVNPYTQVYVDGVAIMAEFAEARPKVPAELSASSPVVRVKGLALMASVNVQRRAMPGSAGRAAH